MNKSIMVILLVFLMIFEFILWKWSKKRDGRIGFFQTFYLVLFLATIVGFIVSLILDF